MRIYVNGVQYGLAATAVAAGTTNATATAASAIAMADNVILVPFVGVQAIAAAAKAIRVHYMCANRQRYHHRFVYNYRWFWYYKPILHKELRLSFLVYIKFLFLH